jgi:1,4-dihydroxy-2-naphthoate octaprenyltransferase
MIDRQIFQELDGDYEHAVLVFVGEDGYPVSAAAAYRADAGRGVIVLDRPAGVEPPPGRTVSVVFSHIRPLPQQGYDERRYVSLWGAVRSVNGKLEFTPERVQRSWDEAKVPFFQYNELTVPQAHRYLEDLSQQQGRPVRPRLAFGWLALRATRLPFLTATLVPVLLGVAVAANEGTWSIARAVLTFFAAAFVHLGLNVANDVFDTLSGADEANTTPTQFSGGSRVIHYGLVSLRGMALISAGLYAAGIAIGTYLALVTDFWPLFILGAIGFAISIVYTAPPFRLVHRGVGEIAVALGFGPIMVLGASFVQSGEFTFEAGFVSIPVAILIALVLYVNEIPDRAGDAAAGKRTLPVRLSKQAVIDGYVGAVGVAYGAIAGGAVVGVIPRPTIIALATIPMALSVARGLASSYEDPYALMPTMGKNIGLHLMTGLLLFAGYLAAIAADRLLDSVPFFLR